MDLRLRGPVYGACVSAALICGLAGFPDQLAADEGADYVTAEKRFYAAYQAGDWDEARVWADQRVSILEQQGDPVTLVTALTHLAAIALQQKDFPAALDATDRGLVVIEPLSATDPMLQLELLMFKAQALAGLGENFDAMDVLDDAVRVNKRIKPHDLLREALIYDQQVSLAGIGGTNMKRQGDRAAEKALEAREDLYGKNSIDLLPGLIAFAEWRNLWSRIADERKVRERAIRLIETAAGPKDYRIAEQSILISKGYIYRRQDGDKAEALLLRALELDYPADIDAQLMHAQALAVLGDVYIVFGDASDAHKYYAQAWQLIADESRLGAAYADKFFAETKQLYFRSPPEPAKAKSRENYFTPGHVLAEFAVLPDGTLDDVELIEVKPIQMDKHVFYKAYARGRYRPRIVAGQPVVTKGVQFKSSYFR